MFASNIQAVVLAAGSGSRMTQLTGGTGGSGMTLPKCLIRVCGNPLIFYPLKTLANYGFQDVLIIHPDREDVRKEVEKICNRLGMKAEYLSVSEDDEDFGTFQSLKATVKSTKLNKTKEDVLLVSCDTIMDTHLNKFINFHKTHSSVCTTLFVKNHLPTLPPGSKLPGPKLKAKPERDIIAVEPDSGRLVFLASEADFEDELRIPIESLRSSSHAKIYTALVDTHIYLLRRNILESFVNNEEVAKFLSVKGEFLPFLINMQWKVTVDLNDDEEKEESPQFKLFALVQPENSCIRVNTVKAVANATKSIDWMKQIYPNDVGGRSKDTTIAKTAKLVGSNLGDQCTVGEKAKLVNVISMDNVTVEEQATVENSIISFNASVGARAVVKECIVGPGYRVPEGARFINESLTVMEENLFGD